VRGPLNVRNIRTFYVLACLVSKRNESERLGKQFAEGKIPGVLLCRAVQQRVGRTAFKTVLL